MISHNIRERLDKDYVRERYSQALKQYKENLEKGNYVVSFLLISALLEERINVSWLLLEWYGNDENLNLVNKPTQSELIGVGIKKIIRFFLLQLILISYMGNMCLVKRMELRFFHLLRKMKRMILII